MTTLTTLLNNIDLKSFREDGYILYHHPLFSAQKFDDLNTLFEEHLANKGAKQSDELDMPHVKDARLLPFLLSEEVLDLVAPIVGPDIILWSSHFICKDPFIGRATPWHEDSAYWKGRVSNYENIVTVWLALDDSNRQNGCMRVIPGSQVNGFSEYETVDDTVYSFGSQIKGVDENKAVYFELKRGESSLHDGRIIHGAEANTSPFRRCGYTLRYLPATTQVYPEANPGHQIWLARGQDRAGNTYVNA